jgi:hypothetical protein
VWQINFKGDTYGAGMKFPIVGESALFAYHHDSSNISAGWLEAGAGLSSVIEKDWTLNLEAIMGSYDWHSAATVKAAFGWQAFENFALNAYVKALVYDSADGKDVAYYETTGGLWAPYGAARLSGVSETTIGLQGMLLF